METGKRLKAAQVRSLTLNFCRKTGIDSSLVWVGAGSALVMHGMREHTQDIDAGCRSDTMLTIAALTGRKVEIIGPEQGYLAKAHIMRFPEYDLDMHSEDAIPNSQLVLVNGIWCYNYHALLQQKLALNRPKDQADIIALKQAILKGGR
jgi:hypothetical protein